ncbi:hypothetical protein GDO81_013139 [Engystomops pustulosus]|uniref:Uncharacterized protein n=1 Tax=Engystomops pustulosus TaxID=76066 RepID=A0AAV7B2X3_ENGPU|nr:hypothetical protein GDO81_013139 [Engystomops pustulosus]
MFIHISLTKAKNKTKTDLFFNLQLSPPPSASLFPSSLTSSLSGFSYSTTLSVYLPATCPVFSSPQGNFYPSDKEYFGMFILFLTNNLKTLTNCFWF